MCWNSDISINTFIFAFMALLFIYVTNTFTKYKTPMFDNPLMYLFFLAVASMQLIEFFLWRNLKNNEMNKLLSRIAAGLVIGQQVILMLMVPNKHIKYGMLLLYLLFLIVFSNRGVDSRFYTSIGKNGHLNWEWINYKGYENI